MSPEMATQETAGDPSASRLIFPRANLTYFFQRKEFEGEAARTMPGPEFRFPRLFEIHASSPLLKGVLTAVFSERSFERVGVLRGEYLAYPTGTVLISESGQCITVNAPPENYQVSGLLVNQQDHLWNERDLILTNWQYFHRVKNTAVLSSLFSKNYYHYTVDFLSGFRLLDGHDVHKLAVPDHCIAKPFQQDLLKHVLGERRILPMEHPFVVVDPFLVQSSCSREGLHWLRGKLGITAKPGGRRIYVTRQPSPEISFGNNLSYDGKLERLLDKYGFETIDFGSGQRTIAEQVKMAEGAELILAVHGANLTNLAYLSPPLTVVEIFSRTRVSSAYLAISAHLGFDHVCIVSDHHDERGDVMVDIDLLEDVLDRALRS